MRTIHWKCVKCVHLVLLYRYKMGFGVKKDLQEAERWYRKAGDAGNRDGQYGMGWMYWRGPAVPRDDAVWSIYLFIWFYISCKSMITYASNTTRML